jgi:hypothetical protein
MMETPKFSKKTNEIARFGWKISCMTRCKAFLVQNINECGKMSVYHNLPLLPESPFFENEKSFPHLNA